MSKLSQNQLTLLDCTLRDGGYYTDWDFPEGLVEDYFETMNRLPVDFIEIGYRSKLKEDYAGAYYYLPEFILKSIRTKTDKRLAIVLNEKEIRLADLEPILTPCTGLVDMVRLAVDPKNFHRAIILASRIKEKGFLVSFNLMYASKWDSCFTINEALVELNSVVDYFYVVDSYGGLYPDDVISIFGSLEKYLKIPLGFHGHNNLELALINSLTAVKAGAEIIDFTVLGMGRGAGNLKTELFLTVLNQQRHLPLDFDALNSLTSSFTPLQETFKWGTNLHFMVSGAFSLAQNSVVSRVKKRFYSLNAMVQEVSDGKIHEKTTHQFGIFSPIEPVEKVLIVGGGSSPVAFSSAFAEYLEKNKDVYIIFASSKNVGVFENLQNKQIHCLAGNEGKRLEKMMTGRISENHIIVLPPREISENNYVPSNFSGKKFQLQEFEKIGICRTSATAFALEIAMQLGSNKVLLAGYDGYVGAVTREELELFEENNELFDFASKFLELVSLTATQYSVSVKSIFAQL